MKMTSPRFVGDDLLQAVFDDPDTGRLKLGPGSPRGAVRRVQLAFWDLGFAAQGAPGMPKATFTDGGYGAGTKNTVLIYKSQYNLRFPPDDPAGIIDDFAGPRTMRKLDLHVGLLDEAVVAIEAKSFEVAAAAIFTILDTDPELPTTHPEIGTRGCSRRGTLNGEPAEFFYKRGLGTHVLTGPILTEFRSQLGPVLPLGFPTMDVTDPAAHELTATFEHGRISVDAAGQTHTIIDERAFEAFPDAF
jgi:hypothetical protein